MSGETDQNLSKSGENLSKSDDNVPDIEADETTNDQGTEDRTTPEDKQDLDEFDVKYQAFAKDLTDLDKLTKEQQAFAKSLSDRSLFEHDQARLAGVIALQEKISDNMAKMYKSIVDLNNIHIKLIQNTNAVESE